MTTAPEHVHPDQLALDGAAGMNAVGSHTGRVFNDAPTSSVAAAHRTRAPGARQLVYDALVARGARGATSIELAEQLVPQLRVSNRASSRLGELWEEGRAAVQREGGLCALGWCHTHEKPHTVHRPTAPCQTHGAPVQRGGANVWVSL